MSIGRGHNLDHTVIFDFGPEEPTEPAAPAPPAGNPDDAAYVRAKAEFDFQVYMAKFRHLVDDYAAAYTTYVHLRKVWATFGSEPKRLVMPSGEAK